MIYPILSVRLISKRSEQNDENKYVFICILVHEISFSFIKICIVSSLLYVMHTTSEWSSVQLSGKMRVFYIGKYDVITKS